MPTALAAPSAAVSRSDSQRSDASRRVTFRRGVDVQRLPARRPPPPGPRREPPPASPAELRRQAEQIVQQVDAARCDVRTTPRPVNNGLRPPAGRDQPAPFGSLGRASLRRRKNKNGVKSVSTNTLPAPPPRGADLEADKNNILKAETLRREQQGELSRLQVDGFLKRSSSQVDHLNNLNSLRDENDAPGRYNNYLDKRPDGETHWQSEQRELNGFLDDKRANGKLADATDRKPLSTVPTILVSPADGAPNRLADSCSQTSPGRASDAPRPRDSAMPRLSPPPRPEKPGSQYRPRGFTYIGRDDAAVIGRDESVQSQSRRIIDQIARERSRSPDTKPSRARPRSRTPSPEPPGRYARTYDFEPTQVTRTYHREPEQVTRAYESDPPPLTRTYHYEPTHVTRTYQHEPIQVTRTYESDPPPLTRTYHHEPKHVTRTYHHESTEMPRTYESDPPPLTRTYHHEPLQVTRTYDSDAPTVTRTYRYEYDSSGELRTYRDDSPEETTKTYRFKSDVPDAPRARRQETTRTYRYQSDAVDEPPPPQHEPPEARRDRYGSSIVMIGGEEPPEIVSTFGRRSGATRLSTVREDSAASDQEAPHYAAPRADQHYSAPRQRPPQRDGDNVIRLSVSGSHSSSARDSATETRRERTVASSRRRSELEQRGGRDQTPPRRPRAPRSRSDSADRETGRRGDSRRVETTSRRVSSSSESPRRRDSRDPSEEPRAPRELNGHSGRRETRETRETRESRESRGHGTLERARRRVDRDRQPDDGGSRRGHRHGDKKKRIAIKFTYDDEPDEPSDVRLAKYVEFTGSDEAGSPSPPAGRRRRDDEADDRPRRRDGGDEPAGRREKEGRRGDAYLTSLIENSRVESGSERRDGRKISPGQKRYDKDLHGEWSSRTEEDRVDAGHRRSEKVTRRSAAAVESSLHEEREKTRSSVSSEETRRQRAAPAGDRPSPARETAEERSASPEPAGKTKKKGWLSSTLSRLDLKSRKSTDSKRRSGSPEPREKSDSQSPERTAEAGRAESARREARSQWSSSAQASSSRRRETRSGSRDSRGTSDERERQARAQRGGAERRESRAAAEHERRGRHAVTERRETSRSGERDGRSERFLTVDSREPRSGDRGSRSGSRQPTPERRGGRPDGRAAPRTAARTSSFSRRYPEDEPDVGPGRGGVGRRSSRRSGGAPPQRRGRRPSHSVTSSLNSSGSEVGSHGPAASRVSNASNRSVYLHATTVADIPSPADGGAPAAAADGDEPLPSRERRRVSRSFSMLSPFRLKHPRDRQINYENRDGQANGRPPRAPRARRASRDDELAERRRQPLARSTSLPKGSRATGGYRSDERPAR